MKWGEAEHRIQFDAVVCYIISSNCFYQYQWITLVVLFCPQNMLLPAYPHGKLSIKSEVKEKRGKDANKKPDVILTVFGLVKFLASVSQLLKWLYVLRLK